MSESVNEEGKEEVAGETVNEEAESDEEGATSKGRSVSEGNERSFGAVGEELATRQIQIEQKRIYLDVRRNVRGVFLKIAESEVSGARSKIIVPGAGLPRLCEVLEHFCKLREANKTPAPVPAGELSKALGMETMVVERKKFYFDLLTNSKGTYMKLSQKFQDKKTNVLFPAAGLQEFRDAVQEVLKEAGCFPRTEADEGKEAGTGEVDIFDTRGMDSRELRMDKKRFFFEVACNQYGTFLRISELSNGVRTRINVPDSGWKEFRDTLNLYIDNIEQLKTSSK